MFYWLELFLLNHLPQIRLRVIKPQDSKMATVVFEP